MKAKNLVKLAEKHLETVKDLRILLENNEIKANYQLVILRSIDLHRKTAIRLVKKSKRKLKNESVAEAER